MKFKGWKWLKPIQSIPGCDPPLPPRSWVLIGLVGLQQFGCRGQNKINHDKRHWGNLSVLVYIMLSVSLCARVRARARVTRHALKHSKFSLLIDLSSFTLVNQTKWIVNSNLLLFDWFSSFCGCWNWPNPCKPASLYPQVLCAHLLK